MTTLAALSGAQMIAYRFTIEGEITAANAAEAYHALTDVLTRIAETLKSYAPQIELQEEARITLVPLPESPPADGPEPEDPAGPDTTSKLRFRGRDAS
jgi:hypothetical protein